MKNVSDLCVNEMNCYVKTRFSPVVLKPTHLILCILGNSTEVSKF